MDNLQLFDPTMLTATLLQEEAFGTTSMAPMLTTPFSEGNMSAQASTIVTCNHDLRLLNVSEFDYPYRKETWIPITWREELKIIAYVISFLISLAGNLLVILVVYYNAQMRTSTNQYLVNLAAADLLVTLVCMWVHIVRHLSHPNYILPALVCKLDSFVQATSMLASVFTLTVISVGRFVAVMFPLQARTSPDRAHRVIAAVWITSALLACPPLFYRQLYSIKWANFTSWQCDEIWPSKSQFDMELGRCVKLFDAKKHFLTAFTVALYFLPVGIMIASYSLVVWRLWMTELPGESSAPARNTATRAKKKVVKMVSVVLLVFVLCWTPLQTLILYSNFVQPDHSSLPSWFSSVEFSAYYIAYSNSALNPIIYCGFNANFRQGLVSLLTCRQSTGRIYHRRSTSRWTLPSERPAETPGNWKGMTGGTRETTVGCSGPEPAILLEINNVKKSSKNGQRAGRSLESSTVLDAHNSLSDSGSESIPKRSVPGDPLEESQVSGISIYGHQHNPAPEPADGLRGRPLKRFSKRSILPPSAAGKFSRATVATFGSKVAGGCDCCKRKGRRKRKSISNERHMYGLSEIRDNISNDTREDMV